MNHLLIDTSNQYLTVVVCKDHDILASTSYQAWQRQSEYLIPEIEKMLKKANLTLKDIQHISCGIGPGSYTGVRISLTITKVLGTLCHMKVSTLSSLAIMGRKDESYVAIMDARSKRSYIGIYDKGNVLLEDQILPNEQVLELIKKYQPMGFKIISDGNHLPLETIKPNYIEGLCSYGLDAKESDPISLKPIYLRDA